MSTLSQEETNNISDLLANRMPPIPSLGALASSLPYYTTTTNYCCSVLVMLVAVPLTSVDVDGVAEADAAISTI
jgi:hypothetical protein